MGGEQDGGQSIPAVLRNHRRLITVIATLATAGLLFGGAQLLRSDPSTHAVLDGFWLRLSGASETRQHVATAHDLYNGLAWAAADAAARAQACEAMTAAHASAQAEYEGGLAVAETGAVRDVVCEHAEEHPNTAGDYRLDRPVHDVIDGHESWLRRNS